MLWTAERALKPFGLLPLRHQETRYGRLQRVLPQARKKPVPVDFELSQDVWTADLITPQQRKAQQRALRGPVIPEFLQELKEYNYQEYVEIGFVWKAIGARGEVLVRVCTSLQDYRVGLPGHRYLLQWTGDVRDSTNPLDKSPQPPLYVARMRHARYKLHNIADVRHNAWQIVLDGCAVSAVAKRLRGWRVFMHVGDIPKFPEDSVSDAHTHSEPVGKPVAPEALLQAEPGQFTVNTLGSPSVNNLNRNGDGELVPDFASHKPPSLAQQAVSFEVDDEMVRGLDAEEVRDFRVYIHWPGQIDQNNNHEYSEQGTTAATISTSDKHINENNSSKKLQRIDEEDQLEGEFDVDPPNMLDSDSEIPWWLTGTTCIGRITDIYRDDNRFYDTGPYIDTLGHRALPGACGVFRIAFRKNLALHPFPPAAPDVATGECGGEMGVERFVELDSLKQEELLHVENADELRELGHLSNGATPLWVRNAPSGLLPLLPTFISHIDFDTEVALVHPDPQWLRDHMSVRMVKKRPPRRTEKAKLTMGGKYRKRVDKAFIRRKGKYARKGRNMRKT